MKQTAVEWLVAQQKKQGFLYDLDVEAALQMEREQIDTSKVTRVEIIQHSPPHNGRAYTNYNAKDVEIQFQDNDRTLKIFLK